MQGEQEAGANDGELAATRASEQTEQGRGETKCGGIGRDEHAQIMMDSCRGSVNLRCLYMEGGQRCRRAEQVGEAGVAGAYAACAAPRAVMCAMCAAASLPLLLQASAALLSQPLHKVVQQQRPLRGGGQSGMGIGSWSRGNTNTGGGTQCRAGTATSAAKEWGGGTTGHYQRCARTLMQIPCTASLQRNMV